MLAEYERALVKLDLQRIARFELGVLPQFGRNHDFSVVSQHRIHRWKVSLFSAFVKNGCKIHVRLWWRSAVFAG